MAGGWKEWALLASTLSACTDTGLPLNGQPIQAAYVFPSCLLICTAHLGKEDVSAVGGTASGGGITSQSGDVSGKGS